ncbi:UNVERIFIED_CONTAM: hypothetical protein GTU68_023040 [Idotea baltica]|nr:hypothetical protein [Idotea baltica]
MRSEQGISPIENQVKLPAGRIAIVAAEWNAEIVDQLIAGATASISACQDSSDDICLELIRVPGSYEIPLAAKFLCESASCSSSPLLGVVALGCLIRGETEHFQLISTEVSRALSELSLASMIPIGLGVICAYSLADAEERAGGEKGNYGEEAADAVIRMIELRAELFKEQSAFSKSPREETLGKICAQA